MGITSCPLSDKCTTESKDRLTEPPLLSFRIDSHSVIASLKSPRMVANSAKRLGWARGPRGDVADEIEPLWPDNEETEDDAVWVGAGDGEGDPNKRRVEENRRDGSLRVDEYCSQEREMRASSRK